MGKNSIAYWLINPVWKWAVSIPAEIAGFIFLVRPDLQPRYSLAWYWYVIIGLLFWAFGTAWEASKKATDAKLDSTGKPTFTAESTNQSGGQVLAQNAQTIHNVFGTQQNEPQKELDVTRKTKIELTPLVSPSGSDLYLSVRVKNNEERTIYCVAQCRAILQEDGKDIKREISDYANHFSWAGGSTGKKEIPSGLDATINLVRRKIGASGIYFTFQENTETNWKRSGLYTIVLEVTGDFEVSKKQLAEISPIGIQIVFKYTNVEGTDSYGDFSNRSTLTL